MRAYATHVAVTPAAISSALRRSIYADCPISSQQRLQRRAVWRNIVTEEKSKVAETLAEFRRHVQIQSHRPQSRASIRGAAVRPVDDHEVTNDWVPEAPFRDRAIVSAASELAARRLSRVSRIHTDGDSLRKPGRIYRKISLRRSLTCASRHALLSRRNVRSLASYGPDALSLGPTQPAWLKRS